MKSPFTATRSLGPDDWHALKLRAIFECCKWDLQREDHSVLAPYALILDREHWASVAQMAEQLTREALAIEQELIARPDLHAHLALPQPICRVLRDVSPNGDGRSTRVMRCDFHFTSGGWKISEVNSDVPGGFIESSGITERFADYYPGLTPTGDPSAAYAQAIAAIGQSVALVHATAYSDDRQVMEHLARRFRTLGLTTTVVSPAHIRFEEQRARFETRFVSGFPDILVRFFPAEWLPNLGHRSRWAGFFSSGATALSNPATALLLQSKRMPLIWDRVESRMDTWRTLLPEVRCPRDIAKNEREEWVFKPALGRVGEDVAISGVTKREDFARLLARAIRKPSTWIAQRRFESVAVETPDGPRYPCLGVFTVDGHAAGCYGRVSAKPLTDADAQDVAILMKVEDKHDA